MLEAGLLYGIRVRWCLPFGTIYPCHQGENLSESGVWDTACSYEKYVLVVDSDPRSLMFLSMIIERFRYRACPALGVGNALEIAGSSPPSLVLTELNLKGLNGLDLLHRLRKKPATSKVPVIFMSREVSAELQQECRQAGGDGFLEKPIQVEELYRAIQPAIDPASRRKDIRIQTRLSITVNDRPLDCAEGECATNLSVKGLHIRTIKAYPVDSIVLVNMTLSEQEVQAEARVAYCEQRNDDLHGMWSVGLQFRKTSRQAGELIRRFINDEVGHGIEPG